MDLFKGMPQKLWIWLGALVILGVAFIVFGKDSGIATGGKNASSAATSTQNVSAANSELEKLEQSMEKKLTDNLSKISGVGQIQALVSLSTGLQSDYARNESITEQKSNETDNSGGKRETTQTTDNSQLVTVNGADQPVIEKEQRPEIAGVLIIAQGAKDPEIKETINTAVRVLLDIPASKVVVESMEGN